MNISTINKKSLLNRLSSVEEEIQTIKWQLFVNTPKKQSIAQKTAGALRKSFPDGMEYQKQARKNWEERTSKIDLKI